MNNIFLKLITNTIQDSFKLRRYIMHIVKYSFNSNNGKKYFNNGKNPLLQNTKTINDLFYSDCCVLDKYFCQKRLDFYKSIIKCIEEEGIDLRDKKILDIGCGTGHLLWYIKEQYQGCHVSGYDFSKQAILYAKKLVSDGDFFTQDIYRKTSKQYDFVLCTEVLEHLEYPEKALKNILAAVKRGGTCLITVPNGRYDTLEEHINFWSPESWNIFITNILKYKKYTHKILSQPGKPLYTFITKTS